ncbi:hypothetical protein Rs2_39652 [Raphanus sativus]|uniref:Uncharacterized protein LOC108827524 n=1 Tax=Raphanus sativus TaxID=3726 RepID=A0A6J0L8J1_RAPSA|nr:uncharacterized protein LOC108827524 [Raphanus sativus]XP_056850281.1 uncharacterized protein LOC130499860 [Raphanus sativus]KAJ4874634.1 hypothetical protein Rs2_39652 [Raphanus sativus]
MYELYAKARDFKPDPVYTDQHCLYFTFSNGLPLTETQIKNFFNRDYSPYVADVFVFRRKGGRGQPLFGKVVFKNTDSPDKIMQNRGKAFFYVEGRPLWCRRWVSKKKETTASASDSLRDGGSHHGGD